MFKIKGLEAATGLITALIVTYYGIGIYRHILEIKDIKRKAEINK